MEGQNNLLKKLEWTMIISFFTWLVFCSFFGELIPEKNGIGFDGAHYAALARQFPSLVYHHQISIYAIQRILPSGIIYYVSQLLGLSIDLSQMPLAFSLYNTVILALGVYIWNKMATLLRWNPSVRFISFCGLFLNFAILKMNTYYPILTDVSAFVCGLLMLYLYLSKKPISLLLTTIAGAFIFPTLMSMGLILFIFLQPTKLYPPIPAKSDERAGTLITLMSALLLTAIAIIIYKTVGERDDFALGRYSQPPVIYLSILALFTYFFLALYPFCQHFQQTIMKVFKQLTNYRLPIAIIIAVLLKTIITFFSSHALGPLTASLFIQLISIRSLAYPAIFLVSSIIYFGPIVCLIMYFWREIICYLKNRADSGLFVITACYSIICINTESRQLINFLPFAVMIVCEVLNTKVISTRFVTAFFIINLILSRAWLPLSHGWDSLLTNPPQITLAFPMQWYFMNQGPWMSLFMYLIFLPVSIGTFYLIWKLARSIKQSV